MSSLRGLLHLSPITAFAMFSLGAKPCTKDPCPPYPPQGIRINWDGETGEVVIPQGAMMSTLNPCVQPVGACSSGPLSGTIGVFREQQGGVSYLRIDPAAAHLQIGPFDQGGTVVEVTGAELRHQDLRIDDPGQLGGTLGLDVSTSHGPFAIDVTLSGQLHASGALDLAITDASMSCE